MKFITNEKMKMKNWNGVSLLNRTSTLIFGTTKSSTALVKCILASSTRTAPSRQRTQCGTALTQLSGSKHDRSCVVTEDGRPEHFTGIGKPMNSSVSYRIVIHAIPI